MSDLTLRHIKHFLQILDFWGKFRGSNGSKCRRCWKVSALRRRPSTWKTSRTCSTTARRPLNLSEEEIGIISSSPKSRRKLVMQRRGSLTANDWGRKSPRPSPPSCPVPEQSLFERGAALTTRLTPSIWPDNLQLRVTRKKTSNKFKFLKPFYLDCGSYACL